MSAEKITDCSSINIGTDEITKIKDAVLEVCRITGHSPKNFFCDTTKPEGVHARAASVRNQKLLLNWSPKVSFENGISETIKWYKAHKDLEEIKSSVQTKLFER